jgi:hypothetical protein
MAAYLRNRVFYALKSVLSPLNLLSSFSNDQWSDRSGDDGSVSNSLANKASLSSAFSKQASNSASTHITHIEPSMERIAVRASQVQNSHTFPKSNSQPEAMTNRDGRRAPALHVGEAAQRRLF